MPVAKPKVAAKFGVDIEAEMQKIKDAQGAAKKAPAPDNFNPLSMGMPVAEPKVAAKFGVDIEAEMQKIKDAQEAAKKGTTSKPAAKVNPLAVKTKVDLGSGSDSDDGKKKGPARPQTEKKGPASTTKPGGKAPGISSSMRAHSTAKGAKKKSDIDFDFL